MPPYTFNQSVTILIIYVHFIYFYLLKCFRLLGMEKAFIFLHNYTQSGVSLGLDSSVTQLCHQEHSFCPFFCAFLDMQTVYLRWLFEGCKVFIIDTGVSSNRQRTPYLLSVKGNISRTLISDLKSYQQRLSKAIQSK